MNELLVDDEMMRALVPRFEQAARLLQEAVEADRQVLVRYDGDADGISSAISIVEALEGLAKDRGRPLKQLRTLQSDGPNYTEAHAQLDLGNAASLERKPLFVFLDHAGNVESAAGHALLKQADFTIIVIDHHPTKPRELERAVTLLVSPWAVADRGSEYPTALLAYEVGRRAWPPQGNRKECAWWGMQADKSPFAPKKELPETVVLDYLPKYTEEASSLPKYRRVLANPAEVKRIYELATEKTKEGLERALKYTKVREFKRLSFALVKLRAQRSKWPSKSKLMNAVHFHLGDQLGRPLVTIGYGGDKILFRANQSAFEAGFRANRFIGQAKAEFPHEIETGGGHEVAAVIKARPEALKVIVDRLAQLIEQEFNQ